MNRISIAIAAGFAALVRCASGQTALPNGAAAPEFIAPAALAGEALEFSLAKALKQGPVVLYFYPAAFTSGCTLEAHLFAEAIGEFRALGASVIGVSRDPIEKLKRFSVSECRGAFTVVADEDGRIMRAYDAVLAVKPDWADRVSYLIAPSGEIIHSYTAMKPDKHAANMLSALRRWRDQHGKMESAAN